MYTFIKPIEKPVNTRQETQTNRIINGSGLTYTLCDRTDVNNRTSNYFSSFNLPYTESAFAQDSLLSKTKPELQQLNVDKIVICPINKEDYNEIIDGRSITIKVPQVDGLGMSAKTVVSSTYQVLSKKQDNELLGSNVAFLFCDEINLPYTGTTNNGTVNKSSNITWNPLTSFVDRPAATSFIELKTSDIGTDNQRTFINQAVLVGEYYPTNNAGYKYDIPVGFVVLDKGWIVFTHPKIVDNIPFDQGYELDGTPNTGNLTKDIYFLDNTYSEVSFVDINIEYKTSIIALVFPNEFYFTTNPSWDLEKNYLEQKNSTFGYDPVSISEIALYNAKNEIIAISKFDRPITKQYNDLVTFTLDINI